MPIPDAFSQQEAANQLGGTFELPVLDVALRGGAKLTAWDRTNAVFVVQVSVPGSDALGGVPRAMHLLGALAEIEQQLAGADSLGTPSMMTGNPSGHDAVEGYWLSSRSQTLTFTFEDDAYVLTRKSSAGEPGGEALRAPTLRELYSLAVETAERERSQRSVERGEDEPAPYRLPDLMGDNEDVRLIAALRLAAKHAERAPWLVDMILRDVAPGPGPATEHVLALRTAAEQVGNAGYRNDGAEAAAIISRALDI
jgi:hypothetical protein